MRIGDHVVYVDPFSKPQQAVLTAVWDSGHEEIYPSPAVNVVWVSADPARTDSYGRQVERATSVPHVTSQRAPGSYWCRPAEYDEMRDRQLREAEAKEQQA
jgi:hypothetical protein